MFGVKIIVTAVADLVARKKNKDRKRCDVCKQKFDTYEAVEDHRRKTHADVVI